jgi:hypothetical protein
MRIARSALSLLAATLLLAATGCATLPEPLQVTVAGIEPLPGEGMELRMLVKLRIQNPNDSEVTYDGAAVRINVMRRTFATGVSNGAGSLPRFGEAIVEVPVTVSVLRMAAQVLGMLDGKPVDRVQFDMTGRLHTGNFGAARFSANGDFEIPKSRPAGQPL